MKQVLNLVKCVPVMSGSPRNELGELAKSANQFGPYQSESPLNAEPSPIDDHGGSENCNTLSDGNAGLHPGDAVPPASKGGVELASTGSTGRAEMILLAEHL